MILIAYTLVILQACAPAPTGAANTPNETAGFDGGRAFDDLVYQVRLGPRVPESEAHRKAGDWILKTLTEAGWQVGEQEVSLGNKTIRNIFAMQGDGEPWLLIGAHYDTRFHADRDVDPALRKEPVPGANDGASGVAVLLELSRAVPTLLEQQKYPGSVWLVFFDAEDNGKIEDWDWMMGAQVFVEHLGEEKPDAVVIVDMVGDVDQQLYLEKNSDQALAAELWQVAAKLGYADRFIPVEKYRILDDHLPFQQSGIPAVDIIDFDYPYWHTTQDTLDKVSADSLDVVGETVLAWLAMRLAQP